MKKLPKVFKNNISKPLKNNRKVFYSHDINYRSLSIDDLFKQNEVYRTPITINLKDGHSITKTIIGRSLKHLITMDNELIPLDDIAKIERK